MNIKNFTQDRNNEMDIIANYQLTQDAILYSLGEKESPLARNYVDNLLKERKKYSIFVTSISVVDRKFQVLRCSSRYYMLPIAVTALDMMFVLSFLHERNKDAQVMIEFFQGRDGIFPLFCMGFFNIYGVYVLAHYCCYKVYCTGYLLEVIHFLRKKSIP